MAAPMDDVCEMSEEKKYKIEVTVVTGFEDVAKEEAEEKLGVKVSTKQGRISFELPINDVNKIVDLASGNHCMVVMNYFEDFQFSDTEHDNLNRLRKLAGDIDWPTGLQVWSRFFSFEHPIKEMPDSAPTDYGEVTMFSNISVRTVSRAKRIKEKLKKRKGKSKNAKTAKDGVGAESNEKIMDGEPQNVDDTDLVAENGAKIESHDKVEIDSDKSEKNNEEIIDENLKTNCDVKIDKLENSGKELVIEKENITNECMQVINSGDAKSGEELTDAKTDLSEVKNNESENTDEAQPKKQRTRLNPWNPLMPSFRVTCNRSGEGHNFHSMNAAANLGGGVYNYFGWNVKMTEMDIEVILNITNEEVTVGIGLTREQLHTGNIKEFGPTTLKPPICYGLLRLCDIQPGDIVCDPMCGVGSIPLQGSLRWPQAYHFGADVVGNATKRCRVNFDEMYERNRVNNKLNSSRDVLRWDACRMPLRSNMVDVFVSDLPFGIRIGNKKDNWKLYCGSLSEMARCAKPSHTRACLLTEDKNCMIKTLQKTAKYWNRIKTLSINIGGLSAGVYLLKRTAAPYEHKTDETNKS